MCSSPNLLRVVQLQARDLLDLERWEKQNWKIDKVNLRAYKMVPKNSRDMPLEEIPEYMSQQLIEVACGQCVQCRLDYSKQWAERCYFESLFYEHNYFITLTYDDEHNHLGKFGNYSIDKEDVRKFIKNLRDYFKRHYDFSGIRYFGCCEYGDITFRNHVHIIFFNLPIPDLTIDFTDENGQVFHKVNKMDGSFYLFSQIISDIWGKGFICIADCNFNTSAYVSRYVLKKQTGKNSKVYLNEFGVEPPYLFMSNRPGIGSRFFDYNLQKLMDDPHLYIPRDNSSPLVTSLPRAFKKKLKVINPQWYEDFTERSRESIAKARSLIQGITTINKNREIQENMDISRSNAFHRDFD